MSPIPRVQLLSRLVDLVGRDTLRVLNPLSAWPALAEIRLARGTQPLSVHVSRWNRTGRGRDAIERRIQNPVERDPVQVLPGTFPIILGLWDEEGPPIVVGFDAERRVKQVKRKSMFFPVDMARAAIASGWTEHVNEHGEHIFHVHPSLVAAYVEMRRLRSSVDERAMATIAEAAGLVGDEELSDTERVRRVSTALVRDALFSRQVRDAYDGLCAVCDLDFELVEGAHIYPARAPGSADKVWNGLALCRNHHGAFDRHLLWVEPRTFRVALHQSILDGCLRNDSCRRFIESTRAELRLPRRAKHHPKSNMFTRRYDFFVKNYDWAR